MTTLKPIGGKMIGIYPIMPESEYKKYLKTAREKGMTVEDYFLEIVRRHHGNEPVER